MSRKPLAIPCLLFAVLALYAPAAQAQSMPAPGPTVEQCEQAQKDIEALRPALAEARDNLSAREKSVRKLERAIRRTSSRRKKRQLRRKLSSARSSVRKAKDAVDDTDAKVTEARETMRQC